MSERLEGGFVPAMPFEQGPQHPQFMPESPEDIYGGAAPLGYGTEGSVPVDLSADRDNLRSGMKARDDSTTSEFLDF